MAKKTCEDFLGSNKAGALCTKLPGLDLSPILQGCITDIQASYFTFSAIIWYQRTSSAIPQQIQSIATSNNALSAFYL